MPVLSAQRANGALFLAAIKTARLVAESISAFPVSPYHNHKNRSPLASRYTKPANMIIHPR